MAEPEIFTAEDGTRHPIVARLQSAVRMQGITAGYLAGFCYGDVHGRFADGTLIHTSAIKREFGGDVFLTRSDNIYVVESWFQPKSPTAA